MAAADTSEEHCVVEEVRCALRLSVYAARRRLDTARTVTRGLPSTLAALTAGVITLGHVEIITEAADRLPVWAGIWHRREDHILDRAADQSPAELRRAVSRAVLRLDPEGAQTRHVTAVLGRRVQRFAAVDGMAELTLHASAADIAAAWIRLGAIARQFGCSNGDTGGRTIDQRRADTCLDLLILGSVSSASSASSGTAAPRDQSSNVDRSTNHDQKYDGSPDHNRPSQAGRFRLR
jgi:hypothetical protein